MKPELELFGAPWPSYFVLLAVAFVAATGHAMWMSRRDRDTLATPGFVFDLGLLSLVGGVIGARLAHVLFDGFLWDYVQLCTDPTVVRFPVSEARCLALSGVMESDGCRPLQTDCWAAFRFWQGGLTYYGGLVLGVVAGALFLRARGRQVGAAPSQWIRSADRIGVSIPLGLSIGRIGCFLEGCCFGRVHDGMFSLTFPPGSAASRGQWRAGLLSEPDLASLPVYPTQFLEAGGCALLFVGMNLAWRSAWGKARPGRVTSLGLIGYAVIRFVLEWFRADDRGGMGALSTSQWIGIALVVGIAAGWILRKPSAPAA